MAWKNAEFTFGTIEEISHLLSQVWGEGHPRHGSWDPSDPGKLFLFGDNTSILCYDAVIYDQDPGSL